MQPAVRHRVRDHRLALHLHTTSAVRRSSRALSLVAAMGVGCVPAIGSPTAPAATTATSGPPPSASASGPARRAYASGTVPHEAAFVDLPVPGYEAAVVSLPRDADGKRPLLVAAHGAWDRPEPHCQLWRRVTAAQGFVLCPRGRRTNRYTPPEHAAYFYPDHFALAREVLAAIDALAERYPERLDRSAAVWAGFSQGAIHGALVIALHPAQFPRAALVEGGNGFFNEWSPFAARKYAGGGGDRVLFACGSVYCVRTAQRCADYLHATQVQTLVAHAPGAGHSYGSLMERQLREHFAWLTAGDPRWVQE